MSSWDPAVPQAMQRHRGSYRAAPDTKLKFAEVKIVPDLDAPARDVSKLSLEKPGQAQIQTKAA